MHYSTNVETARVRISRCERNVDSQRRRLEKFPSDNAARWVAEQLLAASEATLQGNRERLASLSAHASTDEQKEASPGPS